MKIRSFVAPVLVTLAVVAALGSVGCSKKLRTTLVQNSRPEVRLTFAPIDTTHEEFYVYKMNWSGYDPDGRVVRFDYVVDPPSRQDEDTLWVATTKNEETITFQAKTPELGGIQAKSRGYHVFVLRAVDNGGLYSEPVARAFFSFGVAPVVSILTPKPNHLMSPSVPPSLTVSWVGKDFIDPNGYVFEKPLKYKYTLLSQTKIGALYTAILANPDTIRTSYAPDFAGWDSCGAETTSVQYTNLVPNQEYMFVVVAFGRSGAYSPIFTLDTNVLRMTVGYAGVAGPKLTLYNSFFAYSYNGSGGFELPASWAVNLEVPGEQPLTFNWFATEMIQGVPVQMRGYRWAMDLHSLDDETPRSDQEKDWYHWTPWQSSLLSCTVGPFHGSTVGEVHDLYIEAEDVNGFRTVGWIHFLVYLPSFNNELLIVDDTRFPSDQIVKGRPDSLQVPTGNWPNRAELDTFLFARGGVRWRMTPGNRNSWPGLFNGYSYDTLDTRQGRENPTISLSLLGQYRHIVWMTDQKGANTLANVNMRNPDQTITSLRYQSSPNRQNTLATWVSQGGDLFASGGGFAEATTFPWYNPNRPNSPPNMRQNRTYRSDGSFPELVPGRFMYDLVHWKSAVMVGSGIYSPSMIFTRFDTRDPSVNPPSRWPGHLWQPGAPIAGYALLPTYLQVKSAATDSIWPFRNASSMGFGPTSINVELLVDNQSNDPPPDNPNAIERDSTGALQTVLDTLYLVSGSNTDIAPNKPPGQGSNLPGYTALMTHYRGFQNSPVGGGNVTFLGAGLWSFRQAQCQALVDAVLQGIWGLPKNVTVPYARATRTVVGPGTAGVRTVTPGGMQPAHAPTAPTGRSAPVRSRASSIFQRLR